MFYSLLAKSKAQKMARIVGCAPTILSVGGGVGCRNILSRIKVLIITFFAISAVFGGVDCEAYKTQVINDCNVLYDSLQYTRYLVGGIMETSHRFLAYTNENNAVQGALQTIYTDSVSALGRVDTNLQQVNSIKTTAQSLVCNSSDGSCDCAEVLGDINTKLGYIQTLVNSISGSNHTDISRKLTQIINKMSSSSSTNTIDLSKIQQELEDIHTALADISDYSEYIKNFVEDSLTDVISLWLAILQKVDPDKVESAIDNVSSLGNFLNIYTNAFVQNFFSRATSQIPRDTRQWYMYRLSIGGSSIIEQASASAGNGSYWGLNGWLQYFVKVQRDYLASLNNYAWADYNATGVFTNLVASGFDSITNSALSGIKPYIDELDKSPLDGQTGDYFAHLTNDYLSAFSGTNPNTNYFRRIEVLLAAMLFRDNQDSDRISKLEKDIDKIKGDKESLVDSVKPDELIGNYNLGLAMFDDMPNLPTIGAGGLPDTITIEIPKWTGWKDGGGGGESADGKLTIDLKTEKFKGFFDFLHNFFVFVYYGVVLFFVWVAFRCLMRGVVFAYNSVQKLTIK